MLLPWNIFGFIDCSIEQIAVPFLGPWGDYKGTAQRPEYADAQQVFYSGYWKYHSIKIESVFTPDGLSHSFGSLSARPADASVLRTSNLSNFLFLIQRGLWTTLAGAEIIFSVFGDGAYNLGLPCISSYFRSFVGGVELTADKDFLQYGCAVS